MCHEAEGLSTWTTPSPLPSVNHDNACLFTPQDDEWVESTWKTPAQNPFIIGSRKKENEDPGGDTQDMIGRTPAPKVDSEKEEARRASECLTSGDFPISTEVGTKKAATSRAAADAVQPRFRRNMTWKVQTRVQA
ncbi:hypothetical protein NDU88_001565 [Pleurodeles waltl]|uniref:Uncharacterized protein n=1 Tax=Pleurodeles waltl TaxID=8319 RepID=A0AAV7U6T8_PLEWA|nr:hypothetical protein NDU88_001565 [Pleurodeles waltl]